MSTTSVQTNTKPPPRELLETDEDFLDEYSLRPSWTWKPSEQLDYEFYLFGLDLSYFTGKLEAYVRYKGLNFCRVEPTLEQMKMIEDKCSGTALVPQLYDARGHIDDNKRWLQDTTSIIEVLEKDDKIEVNSLSESAGISVIPNEPVLQFLSFLIEDYADEALWRMAMYLRWTPALDRKALSLRFVYEFARKLPIPMPTGLASGMLSFRQWLYSVYGEDITTAQKHRSIFQQYHRILDTLEEILQENEYLGGEYPSLVDFGFAGPLFRHCASDPTPRKIMQQRAPSVYEWVARLFNTKQLCLIKKYSSTNCQGLPLHQWKKLLSLVYEDKYLEYLKWNAFAYREGKRNFLFDGYYVPVVRFRVWCRRRLQERYIRLHKANGDAAKKVRLILEEAGCWQPLFSSENLEKEVVECAPELGVEPPYSKPSTRISSILDIENSGKWPLSDVLSRYIANITAPSVLSRVTLFLLIAYINKSVFNSKFSVKRLFMVYAALHLLKRYTFIESNSISPI